MWYTIHMRTKRCKKCNEDKLIESFAARSEAKDGFTYWCRLCTKKQHKEYRKDPKYLLSENKRQAVQRIKNQRKVINYLFKHPCVDCGETDPLVLEFDHVRGIKKENLGRLLQATPSWKKIMEEIDKCEVRCANCHKRKTFNRNNSVRLQLLQKNKIIKNNAGLEVMEITDYKEENDKR